MQNVSHKKIQRNINKNLQKERQFLKQSQFPSLRKYKFNKLRDFHIEMYQRNKSINQKKIPASHNRYRTISTEQDLQKNSVNKYKKSQIINSNRQIKKSLNELNQYMIQINQKSASYVHLQKDQFHEYLIEKKLKQLIPKYHNQLFSHRLHVQLPKFQDQHNLIHKRRKGIQRKLRKILIVINFLRFLKKYTETLRKIRRNYYLKHKDVKYDVCDQLIMEWLKHSIMKCLNNFQKKSIWITFEEQRYSPQQYENQKTKISINLLNLISKQLIQTTRTDIVKQFIDYIQLTCCRNSFIPNNFFIKKQLSNLYYSQYSSCLHASKSIEQVQIIIFIFIKKIIYSVLLKYHQINKKYDSPKGKHLLLLISSILYHCCCEIIEFKLNIPQQKYIKRGNIVSKMNSDILIYNKKKEEDQYISGLIKKQNIIKLIQIESGSFWNYTKSNIERIVNKFYKSAKAKHIQMTKYYKQQESLNIKKLF